MDSAKHISTSVDFNSNDLNNTISKGRGGGGGGGAKLMIYVNLTTKDVY